ncbi:MAG: PadR family transcriptional regulator [Cyclobacteriaceae bacterium]
MKRINLGELEEMVLLVVANLGANAYGLSIQEYLLSNCDRKVSISTVHSTIHRLEDKGLLESRYGHDRSAERGGRPKLLFQVTTPGMKAIATVRDQRNALWTTMPALSIE